MVMKEGGEVVGDAVQQYINIKQRYSSTLSLAPTCLARDWRDVHLPGKSSLSTAPACYNRPGLTPVEQPSRWDLSGLAARRPECVAQPKA